jgi:hypothetical protein
MRKDGCGFRDLCTQGMNLCELDDHPSGFHTGTPKAILRVPSQQNEEVEVSLPNDGGRTQNDRKGSLGRVVYGSAS